MSRRSLAGRRILQAHLAANPNPLPLKDFGPHVWSAICLAVDLAWRRLCLQVKGQNVDLADLSEPEVTTVLRRVLNDLRDEEDGFKIGFSSELFETVVVDGSEISFDGEHLDKKPDLAFRVRGTRAGTVSPQDSAVFAECKIVGGGGAVDAYCRMGIRRFVRGEYAWAMRRAMMIGFCFNGHGDPIALVQRLNSSPGFPGNDECQTLEAPTDASETCAGRISTKHARTWSYQATGRGPGPIVLLHLWMIAS